MDATALTAVRVAALAILLLGAGACSERSAEIAAVAALTAGTAVAPARAATAVVDEAASGEAIFEHWCLPCHGAGADYPGTMALTQRYGEARAVLLERGDLTEEYVQAIVRNGFNMMPPLKPTEVTDSELERLAAFVASAPQAKREHPVNR